MQVQTQTQARLGTVHKQLATFSQLHSLLNLSLRLILILLFCISGVAVFGQAVDSVGVTIKDTTMLTLRPYKAPSIIYGYRSTFPIAPNFGFNLLSRPLLSQPFFCQIETQIERKSLLAPRFRLGSLDYTNYLEGRVKFKQY